MKDPLIQTINISFIFADVWPPRFILYRYSWIKFKLKSPRFRIYWIHFHCKCIYLLYFALLVLHRWKSVDLKMKVRHMNRFHFSLTSRGLTAQDAQDPAGTCNLGFWLVGGRADLDALESQKRNDHGGESKEQRDDHQSPTPLHLSWEQTKSKSSINTGGRQRHAGAEKSQSRCWQEGMPSKEHLMNI